MENKNGRGIFLGVVSVATLVVAIIGATFAFFSASGGSANDAITANATTLAGLGFSAGSNNKLATNLIPVASEDDNFPGYPGTGASGCLDDVGNQICSIYEFTITNTASVAQQIYVSFDPVTNTFDNLYFAAFKAAAATANYEVATGSSGSGANFALTPATTTDNSTLGHEATKLTKNSTTSIPMTGLTTTLQANGAANNADKVTYTIIVWLQETKADQNIEQGKTFAAGVHVTTANDTTGVTGVMAAGRS